MKKERIILVATVIGMAFGAVAQSLTKEIKVERDIVPEYRDADRLPLSPVISLPSVTKQNLNYSLVDRPVGVTPSVFTLGLHHPAYVGEEIFPGYAVLGYMPKFNAAASIGYRFLNTEKTTLGAWLQYNGRSYHPIGVDYVNPGKDTRDNYTEHAASASVNLTHATGENSKLSALMDYTYSHRNFHGKEGVNNLNLSLQWGKGTREDVSYGIGGDFSRFAFINGSEWYNYLIGRYKLNPVRQNKFNLAGHVFKAFSSASKVFLGVDFSYLHSSMSDFLVESDKQTLYYREKSSFGSTTSNIWLLRFTPGYHYAVHDITMDLGVKVDLSHGSGKAFHIAPDVKIAYTPSSFFGVEVNAGGGEVQNTAASLYYEMPYMAQYTDFQNSHIPFTLDGTLVFGPFKGGYFEIFGGYAKANNWIMPFKEAIDLEGVNVSGWHAGMTAGYRRGEKFEAKVSAEFASSSDDIKHTYYLWRDRARYVIDANAKWSPLEKLDITLGYMLRGKRKMEHSFDLGSFSSFQLGAAYKINPHISVFADGQNLFNHSNYYIGHVPAQGITGLAGVTLKF